MGFLCVSFTAVYTEKQLQYITAKGSSVLTVSQWSTQTGFSYLQYCLREKVEKENVGKRTCVKIAIHNGYFFLFLFRGRSF